MTQPHAELNWRKSAASGAIDCVEVAFAADGAVHLRDSKATDGPMLTFNTREWTAFLTGARNGEFDHA